MNCFEWQNRLSDYLDGSLIGSEKAVADEHLEKCSGCKTRYQRIRLIQSTISSQQRAVLPAVIRKAPLSFSLSKISFHTRTEQWRRAPWFVRSSVEGAAITLIILFVVAMVPRVRHLYERSIERRLDVFSAEEMIATSDSTERGKAPPLIRGKTFPISQDSALEAANSEFDGEFASEEEVEGSTLDTGQQTQANVRVGNSEIWRFVIKSDSPHELRAKVVSALKETGVDATNIGGIEAPGGIQFDILVPKDLVPGIKQHLQKLATPSTHPQAAEANWKDNFTWYKNKSKRPIPIGKSRVVIWLSQI